MRGGKNDSAFGSRCADRDVRRPDRHALAKTRKRLGFEGLPALRTDLFVAPRRAGASCS
jgi:hypothetical protein